MLGSATGKSFGGSCGTTVPEGMPIAGKKQAGAGYVMGRLDLAVAAVGRVDVPAVVERIRREAPHPASQDWSADRPKHHAS